jgi:hypothetical protein
MSTRKFYFNQFWAFQNPCMLTMDGMRKELYRIWCEVWDACPKCEQKTMMVCKAYKERVIKGKPTTRE